MDRLFYGMQNTAFDTVRIIYHVTFESYTTALGPMGVEKGVGLGGGGMNQTKMPSPNFFHIRPSSHQNPRFKFRSK